MLNRPIMNLMEAIKKLHGNTTGHYNFPVANASGVKQVQVSGAAIPAVDG